MATQAHDYLSRHSMQLGMYLQVWSPGQEWKQHVHFRLSFSPTHVPAGWRTDTMAGQELGQPPEIMRLTIHAAWVSDTFTVSTFNCLGVDYSILEEGMATHSSILAWRIPRTEEAGGLQAIGLQRVGHDRSDLAHTQTIPWEWNPLGCLNHCY